MFVDPFKVPKYKVHTIYKRGSFFSVFQNGCKLSGRRIRGGGDSVSRHVRCEASCCGSCLMRRVVDVICYQYEVRLLECISGITQEWSASHPGEERGGSICHGQSPLPRHFSTSETLLHFRDTSMCLCVTGDLDDTRSLYQQSWACTWVTPGAVFYRGFQSRIPRYRRIWVNYHMITC